MPEGSQPSLSAWRFMVIYEINGDDMDAASDKLALLDKAAKRLGIAPALVDGSGPPRQDAP